MTAAITTWGRRLVLLLMLPLSCLFGNVAPYLVVLTCVALAIVYLIERRLIAAYREELAALFLAGFASLAACFAVTATQPGDAIYALNFVMLVLAGPLLLAMRDGAAPLNTSRIAWLALAGAAIAFALVGLAVLGGETRGYWRALGPIRISNTALLLGFIALAGLFVEGSRWRWLLLLGPVFGIAVTLLSESRGPLLALALMAPLALAFGWRLVPRSLRLPGGVALVILIGAGTLLLLTQERFTRLPQIVGDIMSGSAVGDYTTQIRFVLYRAAIEAIQQSPWIGHGWANLMTAVQPFLDGEGSDYAATLPQLHNDVLDFAVAAGVVGIAVYLLLLAAPLVAAWRSPHDSQRLVRLYGASVLVASYVGAGLTDLMFGFEFHTALYVVLAAILIGYCRDRTSPESQ